MQITLLIDLDDTLLITNLDVFIQSYFKALQEHGVSYGFQPEFIGSLVSATRKMLLNLDVDRTLEDVFFANFIPALQPFLPQIMRADDGKILSEDISEISKVFDVFYKTVFPSLKKETSCRSQSRILLEDASRREFRTAIATNPLFPKTATLQRLDWANLPSENGLYELVSTYEYFHFAKPHPEYLAEVLAQLGWPEGAVLVIGNDLVDDIEAAQKLGLATFWIQPNGQSLSRHDNPLQKITPMAMGDLEDILPWLDSIPLESLVPNYKTPDAMLAILRSTPASLSTLAKNLRVNSINKRIGPDEWSLVEIINHMNDVEENVHLPQIKQMLAEDKPYLNIVDLSELGFREDYDLEDFNASLLKFVRSREQLISLLYPLDSKEWGKEGFHEEYGNIQFFDLVWIIGQHDQNHVRQFHKIIRTLLEPAL